MVDTVAAALNQLSENPPSFKTSTWATDCVLSACALVGYGVGAVGVTPVEPKHRLYLLVHPLQQLLPVTWHDVAVTSPDDALRTPVASSSRAAAAAVVEPSAAPERVVWSSVTAPTHTVRGQPLGRTSTRLLFPLPSASELRVEQHRDTCSSPHTLITTRS